MHSRNSENSKSVHAKKEGMEVKAKEHQSFAKICCLEISGFSRDTLLESPHIKLYNASHECQLSWIVSHVRKTLDSGLE